jgi:hypothetical protein
MSLAAAVAVAGLTTSASAANLEDAIKGVTISGQINVEWQQDKTDAFGTADDTSVENKEYDFDATANIPVNDMITAQIGVQADKDVGVREDSTGNNTFDVTKLNFTAKTDFGTFIVGKQKQPTPFLDDDRGDGVVALIPAGPVTLAAGHFTGMTGGQDLNLGFTDTAAVLATSAHDGNMTGVTVPAVGAAGSVAALQAIVDGAGLTAVTASGEPGDYDFATSTNLNERDITAVAVIGTFGPVNAQAWYLTASGADGFENVENGLDGYSLNLNADIEGIKVDFNHAQLGLNGQTGFNFDDETLTKLTVSTSIEGINLVAGYGTTNNAVHTMTGTDANYTNATSYTINDRLHGADLTDDNDAATNMSMEIASLDNYNDADAFLLGASATMGQYTFGATYLDGDAKYDTNTKEDFSELDLKVTYAMSKNFSVEGVYAMAETKTNVANSKVDYDTAILRATYKF